MPRILYFRTNAAGVLPRFRKVTPALLRQFVLVRKFLDHPLVRGGGLVVLALLPVALRQAEQGRGRRLPILVVLRHHGLVGLNRGIQVLVRIFFNDALAQRLRHLVLSGAQTRRDRQESQYHRSDCTSTGQEGRPGGPPHWSGAGWGGPPGLPSSRLLQ